MNYTVIDRDTLWQEKANTLDEAIAIARKFKNEWAIVGILKARIEVYYRDGHLEFTA